MAVIWVVVANKAEARIYSQKRLRGPLSLVKTRIHDEGRAHLQDLVSDQPGRVHDRMGPARHRMEPNTGFQEEDLLRFARDVTDHLATAHQRKEFDRLVLIAAPAFLGMLRKTVSPNIAEVIIDEIPKDMIGHDVERIQEQLN
jgi:protein required for attachment to host cells